jgi:hypothetical protein
MKIYVNILGGESRGFEGNRPRTIASIVQARMLDGVGFVINPKCIPPLLRHNAAPARKVACFRWEGGGVTHEGMGHAASRM